MKEQDWVGRVGAVAVGLMLTLTAGRGAPPSGESPEGERRRDRDLLAGG